MSRQHHQQRNKFRNQRCVIAADGRIYPWIPATPIQGIRFDSMKEARRWLQLRALEKAGRIAFLRRQRRLKILVNGVCVSTYVADFVYVEDGREVVEDVKSKITRQHPLYLLKKRLVKAALGIEIRET